MPNWYQKLISLGFCHEDIERIQQFQNDHDKEKCFKAIMKWEQTRRQFQKWFPDQAAEWYKSSAHDFEKLCKHSHTQIDRGNYIAFLKDNKFSGRNSTRLHEVVPEIESRCSDKMSKVECLRWTSIFLNICWLLEKFTHEIAKDFFEFYFQLRKCAEDGGLLEDEDEFGEVFAELYEKKVPMLRSEPNQPLSTLVESCYQILERWQLDARVLRGLNLHLVISKHLRSACRSAGVEDDLLSFYSAKEHCILHSSTKENYSDLMRSIFSSLNIAHFQAGSDGFESGGQEGKFSKLKLGPLQLFHSGLETLIGYPAATDVMKALSLEHARDAPFPRPSGESIDPKREWNIVMKESCYLIENALLVPAYCIAGRDITHNIQYYFDISCEKVAEVKRRDDSLQDLEILLEEVAALRLWTGPMYSRYANEYRNANSNSGGKLFGNAYVSTLHTINSGITKLARLWRLPTNRKIYRGYKDLRLGELQPDHYGTKGGVDASVLATTEDLSVAESYCKHGFILEIQVGQIDRGADVSWLSQFPHEKEVLFPALSNLEFVGEPFFRITEQGKTKHFPVRINANLKSKTLEQFQSIRKDLHIAMTKNLWEELQALANILSSQAQALLDEGSNEFLRPRVGKVNINEVTSTVAFPDSQWSTAEAQRLAVSAGKYYFEIEVVDPKGNFMVGWAETKSAFKILGDDHLSWAVASRALAIQHRNELMPVDIDRLGEAFRKIRGQARTGMVLGVALDLESGHMSLCFKAATSSFDWTPVKGCVIRPDQSGNVPKMFPALSGNGGAELRYNFGNAAGVLSPPDSSYVYIAAAKKQESTNLSLSLQETGLCPVIMVKEFEDLFFKHTKFMAKSWNIDETYKLLLNEALEIKVGLEKKMKTVVMLLRAGASIKQLLHFREAPAADFYACKDECLNLSWKDILLHSLDSSISDGKFTIPLLCPPCQIMLVWEAAMKCPLVTKFQLGQLILAREEMIPKLNITASRLVERAILGFLHAISGPDILASEQLVELDLQHCDFSDQILHRIATFVVESCRQGKLKVVNQFAWSDFLESRDSYDLGSCIRRRPAEKDKEREPLGTWLDALDWTLVLAKAADLGWENLNISKQLDAASAVRVGVCLLQLTSLTCLNISENQLGLAGGKAVAAALATFSALTSLDISKNELGSDCASAIAESLAMLTGLRSLNISSNSLNLHGINAIGDVLTMITSLSSLDFWKNGLGHAGWERIGELLDCCVLTEINGLSIKRLGARGDLEQLDISVMTVGFHECFGVLAHFLPRNASSLVHLVARGSDRDDGMALTKVLWPCLGCLTVLKSLDLSQNDHGFNVSLIELRNLIALESLDLRKCKLNAAGWNYVADVLEELKCLTSLNGSALYLTVRIGGLEELCLEETELGVVVARYLPCSSSTLTKLDLRFNELDSDCGTALAHWLSLLTNLSWLSLSGNCLDAAGGTVIGKAIAGLTTLRSFDISSNTLGKEGVLAVSSYLVGLSLLESVEIHDNLVTGEWKAVAAEFARLPALTRIVLLHHERSGLHLDDSTIIYIRELLLQVTDLYLC